MKICLVEDDLELGKALQAALQDAGQEVVWVRRASDARHWVETEPFDAVLLDLGLPDGNGIDVLRELRAGGHTLPILVITARDSLEDRLNGLDRGADDYLVKPFVVTELLARLRAVMRRATGWSESGEPVWKVKDLVLDDKRMLLTRSGVNVVLSKTEFALLHALMRYPDRVLTRRELESRALPHSEGAALDVHMSHLRQKIGEGYIRTVRGVGYVVDK
ncbi:MULTISPECIES: response regulator transcription factor [Oxalobacteraceae]|uniref:response regulator transcription factor n=1 Tax=Oxalobacteraceae TaxID=75682 RepID=UPI0002AEE02E|nr:MULTISPECIES: response regulator transcription factor [Oxalobacteraceae]ELX08609.1 swarming motility regulation protein RssB [Janthinobacterium sp. HH01]OEZ63969.1 swarming motility regulation protein RssB [Duganella sp. HH105]OFA06880.1 swarming motility regulation protein RssB [Duganella sp. HH101]